MSKTSYFHRFLRQPNHASTKYSRIGNRFNPFENTLTILKDPKHNRELYLIGTTNSSTLLAYRTKKLVSQIKPASVYVQTNKKWWETAKLLNLQSQSQFNHIVHDLPGQDVKIQNNLRGLIFKLKYYTWFGYLSLISSFPQNFKPFSPGLQVKFALQEAQKNGSSIVYGGQQLNQTTVDSLRRQPNLYFTSIIWRHWTKLYKKVNIWNWERQDFFNILYVRGGQAFAESLDRTRANFMVGMFNRLAPDQKKILIDQKDQNLFYDIYRNCKGNTVAVVNQWHVEGIEQRWRRATGTQNQQQPVSPIADMDIDAHQENDLINEYLRQRASKLARSQPATAWNYIVQYHKQNFEPERTRHTDHTSHEDIPQPGEEPKHKHH